MQSKSYAIALTGIATSMAIIFVTMGNFIRLFDFSFYFLAGLALLLPISLGYHLLGFLAYLVTALLGLLFGGLTSPYYIFFCSFFGLQPLLSGLLQKLKWHTAINYALETVYFIGATLLTYFIAYKLILKSPIVWVNNLGNYIYLILIAVAIPVYILYAFLMRRISKRLGYFLETLQKKQKNGGGTVETMSGRNSQPKTEDARQNIDILERKIKEIDPFSINIINSMGTETKQKIEQDKVPEKSLLEQKERQEKRESEERKNDER